MNPGKLDRLISIQELTTSVDSYGGHTNTFNNPVLTPAHMSIQGGGRKQSGLSGYEYNIVFTIRYKSGITPETHRIQYDGQKYDILVVMEMSRRQWLKIVCKRTTHQNDAV
jgi:SPP1 family predicted phage head-tail adaptor